MLSCLSLSGTFKNSKPFLVENKEIILSSCGSIIQIISTKTGELLQQFKEHQTNVSCIISYPFNSDYIISSSFDGVIFLWNYLTHEIIQKFEINLIIHKITLIPFLETNKISLPNEIIISTDKLTQNSNQNGGSGNSNNNDEIYKLVILNLRTKRIRKNISEMRHSQNVFDVFPHQYSTLPNDYMIVANKRKLVFWALQVPGSKRESQETSKYFPGEQIQTICSATELSISALIICSEKDMLITGHDSGEIILWHNISSFIKLATEEQRVSSSAHTFAPPPCTILHWHAHPVSCLSLSPDSTHFYSGGYEGVLVSWEISTNSHNFVPRLGGSILQMSSSKSTSQVAVCCSDNSLKLINISTMKEDWTIQLPCLGTIVNLRHNYGKVIGSTIIDAQTVAAGGKHAKIQVDVNPISGHIVSNGYPGQLQMIDITTLPINTSSDSLKPSYHSSSFVLDSIQILSYNRISRTENPLSGSERERLVAGSLKYFVPSVTLFSFHTFQLKNNSNIKFDVNYLATVDVTRGEELDPESSLKIWVYSSSNSNVTRKFKLLTQVDSPHASNRITSLVFFTSSPSRPSLASSSSDGSIKIWASGTTNSNSSNQTSPWICLYSFTYRNCSANGLSVSGDSTVLSVSYGTTITFWDPNNVELKGTVPLLTSSSIVTHTAFIEPRRSSNLGGGCGIVYFVAVTDDSITVINVLSLEVIWKKTGIIYAFASSPSDGHILKFSSNNGEEKVNSSFNSNLSNEAWFAVSMKDNPNDSQPQIHFFSPLSSTPLYSYQFSHISYGIHLKFWSSQDPTFSFSRGLIVTTSDAQLLLLSFPINSLNTLQQLKLSSSSSSSVNILHNNSRVKKIQSKKEDQNILNSNIKMLEEKNFITTNKRKLREISESNNDNLNVKRSEQKITNITTEIFDSSSSTIPHLSSVYEEYMKKMLTPTPTSSSSSSITTTTLSTNTNATSIVSESDSNNSQILKNENNSNDTNFVILGRDKEHRSKIRQQLHNIFSIDSSSNNINITPSINIEKPEEVIEKPIEVIQEPQPEPVIALKTPVKTKSKSTSKVTNTPKIETPALPTTPAPVIVDVIDVVETTNVIEPSTKRSKRGSKKEEETITNEKIEVQEVKEVRTRSRKSKIESESESEVSEKKVNIPSSTIVTRQSRTKK